MSCKRVPPALAAYLDGPSGAKEIEDAREKEREDIRGTSSFSPKEANGHQPSAVEPSWCWLFSTLSLRPVSGRLI